MITFAQAPGPTAALAWLICGVALTAFLVACVLFWATRETIDLRARRREQERARIEQADDDDAPQPQGELRDDT